MKKNDTARNFTGDRRPSKLHSGHGAAAKHTCLWSLDTCGGCRVREMHTVYYLWTNIDASEYVWV